MMQSALMAAAVVTAAASTPRHILFVMVDDLGFNDVSYRNTSDLSSPTIDSLAMAGIRLERYYTHNLCSPSRTAFLSGRFASTIGMQGCVIINGQAVDLPKNVSTVAERLHDAGFKSAAFGKWDAGMTTWDYTPTCRGFDYFYGFYGPAQDHFTHESGGAIDLRENFDAVKNESGTYSTQLYTAKAQQWIADTVAVQKANRTFIYLAYQAMHAPIEAPQLYIDRCGKELPGCQRQVYCAMMLALDEGIANVTSTYKSLGIWNDTLMVLAADNGGHVGASGNNFPLRGEKSTNYEGGVRGVSFVHWAGLDPVLKGTTSQHLIHVADWLPTFVGGIAGLDLGPDGYKYPVDGINQWPALTTPGAAGPRSVIVHEIGGDNRIPQEAYLDGQYKIIRHHPTIYNNDRYVCETVRGVCDCSLGWCPVPGRGPAVPPPAAENQTNSSAAAGAFVAGGTWLFDVVADPLEHNELSSQQPGVVARLEAALDALKARDIDQRLCPVDANSNPEKFFGGVWTPWRGARAPQCNAGGSNEYCQGGPPPPPGPPGPPGPAPPPHPHPHGTYNSSLDGLRDDNGRCLLLGWCCSGLDYSGPALAVEVILDGKLVSTGTANVSRPVAGNHGFEVALPSCQAIVTGRHTAVVSCRNPVTGWAELRHSPLCTVNGKKVPCPTLPTALGEM